MRNQCNIMSRGVSTIVEELQEKFSVLEYKYISAVREWERERDLEFATLPDEPSVEAHYDMRRFIRKYLAPDAYHPAKAIALPGFRNRELVYAVANAVPGVWAASGGWDAENMTVVIGRHRGWVQELAHAFDLPEVPPEEFMEWYRVAKSPYRTGSIRISRGLIQFIGASTGGWVCAPRIKTVFRKHCKVILDLK